MQKKNKADSKIEVRQSNQNEIRHITVIGFANKASSGTTKIAAKRNKNA